MKFDHTKLSFNSALGQSEEYNVILTYDTTYKEWYGMVEVIEEESFVPLCDLSDEQVEWCRELIPSTHLPSGQ